MELGVLACVGLGYCLSFKLILAKSCSERRVQTRIHFSPVGLGTVWVGGRRAGALNGESASPKHHPPRAEAPQWDTRCLYGFSDLYSELEYDCHLLFPVEAETQKLNIYQFKAQNF